jgi:hypothetical protein
MRRISLRIAVKVEVAACILLIAGILNFFL